MKINKKDIKVKQNKLREKEQDLRDEKKVNKNIQFSEIVKVKKILKSDPKILWKYLQKKET